MRVTVIFVQHTRTIETHTKDHIFCTPVAEAIHISKPKGFANVARMLTLILKHHLRMEKLEPDALSTPFPGQVLKKVFKKLLISFPKGAATIKPCWTQAQSSRFTPPTRGRKQKHSYLPLFPFLIVKGEALRFLWGQNRNN